MTLASFLTQDVPMLAAGVLASMSCAVVGAFLVLRRLSLMGDAISHAVLPGIVGGFLLHNWLETREIHSSLSLVFFAGAVVVGIATAALSELIHRLGRVEPGASMGIVFTVLFAIGVILLERFGGRTIHLDADCVLYGAMENVLWTNPPSSLAAVFTAAAWADFPRQVTTLAIVLVLNCVFVIVFFKELRISSFDPGLAAALGFRPGLMHYLLMTLVAVTTVAAFEAVGSILVVAMLIVPGLAAHLLTDRLSWMVALSAIIGGAVACGGYAGAVALKTNAAGMIGVALGVTLALVAVFAPRHGWFARRARPSPVA